MSVGGSHEPNLTPFIDLFSVLTCFLLMTAAWIHLDSIGVKMGPITSAPAEADPSTPPPPKKLALSVELNDKSIVVSKNEEKIEFTTSDAGLAAALTRATAELSKLKLQFATEVLDVTLTSKGAVYYGDLIKVYDAIISSGWDSVAISPY